MSIYPFTLRPIEYSNHTESPRLARSIWLRIRKTDPDLEYRPWYAEGQIQAVEAIYWAMERARVGL